MSVYVDDIFHWTPRDPITARYGSAWCNMWADSVPELKVFAERISINPAWFVERAKFPHYDITGKMRERAVVLGAIETTWPDWIWLTENKKAKSS